MNRLSPPDKKNTFKSFLEENKVSFSLSIGLGCVLSFFLIGFLRIKLLNIIKPADLLSLNITKISFVEILVLLIGVISVFIAPLRCRRSGKIAETAICFVVIVFLNIIFLMQAFIRQNISNRFVIVITVTCIFLVWTLSDALKAIYSWIRTDSKVDVVKLTFVWITILSILVILK